MTDQSQDLAAWSTTEAPTEMTVKAMDELVAKVASQRAEYEARKKAATEAHDVYEALTQEMIGVLKATGRTSHTVPGVGLVRFATKESYRVPATAEAKRELFKYIQTKYGVDTLTEMLSIHAAKINAWANAEIETDPGLQIPGLEAPTMTEVFYFNKK